MSRFALRVAVLVGAALLTAAAVGHATTRFPMTAYECEQTTAARHGFRCALHHVSGTGTILFIRVHTRPDAPDETRKRTTYLVQRAMHNFVAEGGTWVQMRVITANGQPRERLCSRAKGRTSVYCNDWRDPFPEEARYWKRLE